MKKTRMFLLLIAMLAAIAFTACGGGGGGGDEGGGAPSGGGGGGPTLVSIAVTPNNQSIATGHTQQFTATGAYSDGSTQNLTSSATWSSSDTAVATINSAGLAAASSNKSGPLTITATSASISGSAQLMVAVNLPKTGQTTSYVTGDDGDLQRGIAWPSPRFTDNNNGTVTDNLTGLIWLKRANCANAARDWATALSDVAQLNIDGAMNGNNCGDISNGGSHQTDWRLPNRKELRSLINYEQANTAAWLNLPAQGFSNVLADGYWSSSTYAGSTTVAWDVSMWGGEVYGGYKTNTYNVWPVRAGGGGVPADLPKTGQATCYDTTGTVIDCATTGQDGELQKGVAWPSPRFTDNSNGTVTDNLTGLMWTQNAGTPTVGACTGGVRTWQEALDYVACLNTNNYLGYADWRLPNVNELESLINAEQANTATWLNTQGFSNVQADGYWSSSTYGGYTTYAWVVDMWDGSVDGVVKANTDYVWPVRAGQ